MDLSKYKIHFSQLIYHTHIPDFIQCLVNYWIKGGNTGLIVMSFYFQGKKTDIFRKSVRNSFESRNYYFFF